MLLLLPACFYVLYFILLFPSSICQKALLSHLQFFLTKN